MSQTELKPGDVVALKSGGPKMTLEEPVEQDNFWCVWFCGDEYNREIFVAAGLILDPDYVEQQE